MRQSVLVVDEPTVAMDVEEVLEALDYHVAASAGSVAQALQRIRLEPLHAAIVADRLGDQSTDEVADELAGRSIPFMFVTAAGGQILPARFSRRPAIGKPFELPALVVAITRLTGIEPGSPLAPAPPPSHLHPYSDADLDDVERRIAETGARIGRIESLIWHRPTRDGKRLLIELRKLLDTMIRQRSEIRSVLRRDRYAQAAAPAGPGFSLSGDLPTPSVLSRKSQGPRSHAPWFVRVPPTGPRGADSLAPPFVI